MISHVLYTLTTAENTVRGFCSDGDLRLEGASDNTEHGSREGRIEICFNNAWGTVCNSSFNIPDAMVACNQLTGFERDGNNTFIHLLYSGSSKYFFNRSTSY